MENLHFVYLGTQPKLLNQFVSFLDIALAEPPSIILVYFHGAFQVAAVGQELVLHEFSFHHLGEGLLKLTYFRFGNVYNLKAELVALDPVLVLHLYGFFCAQKGEVCYHIFLVDSFLSYLDEQVSFDFVFFPKKELLVDVYGIDQFIWVYFGGSENGNLEKKLRWLESRNRVKSVQKWWGNIGMKMSK